MIDRTCNRSARDRDCPPTRWLLTDYNADVRNLFTPAGRAHFEQVPLSEADRFVGEQYWLELEFYRTKLVQTDLQIVEFARAGSPREQEARALLRTIPGVGPIVAEIVLAELAGRCGPGNNRHARAKAICDQRCERGL